MRKLIICFVIAFTVTLVASAFAAEARFRLLAPSEDAFLSGKEVLLIAKVEGFHEAKMVEIFDNGKTIGFAPLKKGVLFHRFELPEGRHELILAAPDIKRQSLKVFRGKQEGYRYHIETDTDSCKTCHPDVSRNVYKLSPVHSELCAQCHDAVNTGEFIHGPVAAGSCTPCHDPHGSRNDYFLVANGKDLCLNCHSQDLSKEHIGERQNAECTKCHDPHSSAKNYHLH
jgi:predicted CXXCH cytochrome family protein